jgi:hypothetical protein
LAEINDLLSLSYVLYIPWLFDYFLRTSVVEDLSAKTFVVSPVFELDEADTPVGGGGVVVVLVAAVLDVLVATCAPLAAF